ncbi:MAG: hypothetical protein XXXJIFNMEKO3_02311 [Candidatus Erwinia impunctatus]|nr:hypothetical protein XXXJIFNMEKO_02311 [Culicoides impunctatus]
MFRCFRHPIWFFVMLVFSQYSHAVQDEYQQPQPEMADTLQGMASLLAHPDKYSDNLSNARIREEAALKARLLAEAKARAEEAAKLREAAEAKARAEALVRNRIEEQEKARREAIAKAREDAQAKTREKAAIKAQAAEEARLKKEEEKQAREDAARKARDELASRERAEQEEKADKAEKVKEPPAGKSPAVDPQKTETKVPTPEVAGQSSSDSAKANQRDAVAPMPQENKNGPCTLCLGPVNFDKVTRSNGATEVTLRAGVTDAKGRMVLSVPLIFKANNQAIPSVHDTISDVSGQGIYTFTTFSKGKTDVEITINEKTYQLSIIL